MATKQSKKSAQSKKRVNTQKTYDPKKNGLSTPAKILIAFFAVLMALSLMIPSISAIFGGGSSGTQTITIDDIRESINNQYEMAVSAVETQLEADPTNVDLLKQLGNYNMQWAASLTTYSLTDEQVLEAYGHAKKAKEYFDTILEDTDDTDIAVSAAMCTYYYGEPQTAIKMLEEIAEKDPDFAGTYANLGMLYETQGDTEKAIEYYNLAIEKDPDDEEQAKSYAETRLAAIASAEEAADATDTTDGTETTDGTDTTDTTDTTDDSTSTDDTSN